MWESLRSRGDWGREGGSVIATPEKKESSQLLCAPDCESRCNMQIRPLAVLCVCVCVHV